MSFWQLKTIDQLGACGSRWCRCWGRRRRWRPGPTFLFSSKWIEIFLFVISFQCCYKSQKFQSITLCFRTFDFLVGHLRQACVIVSHKQSSSHAWVRSILLKIRAWSMKTICIIDMKPYLTPGPSLLLTRGCWVCEPITPHFIALWGVFVLSKSWIAVSHT